MITISVKSFLELCVIFGLLWLIKNEEDLIEIEQMLPRFFRYHWHRFLRKIKKDIDKRKILWYNRVTK